MKTAILILAAGKSSRMGKTKQLLPVGTTTLLGTTIESALASKASKTYCVVGFNFKAITKSIKHYAVEAIINNNYQLGLSSSITTGMQHLEPKNYDATLILLADQPNINSEYINRFLHEITKHPTKIIGSSYNGSVGVPAIFPKSYYHQLLNLKGDKGAKDLLNSSKTRAIRGNSSQLIDIDTWQDYSEFLKSI